MLITITKIYAFFYLFIRSFFSINIPGLGFFLRRIKKDFILEFRGNKMFFNHKVASSYGLHIIGLPQEKETHLFLDFLFDSLKEKFSFVDVGANVGAFLIHASSNKNAILYGFEPFKECILAIENSLKINGVNDYHLFNNLVGDKDEYVYFNTSIDAEGASVYNNSNLQSAQLVTQIKLDSLLINIESPSIWLIDVEGYEPKVLEGGKNLIKKLKPLIIFEYNKEVSKKHFSITDIQELLGNEYKIYRLNYQGNLDADVENAWNCVAIPNNTFFSELLEKKIH